MELTNKKSSKSFFSRKRVWITSTLAFVVISITLLSFTDDKRNFAITKNLDIYFTLFRELNSYYVDETDPEKLIKTSIDGMLESLDPYTEYIPESEMEDFRFMTTLEYAGIGSLIGKRDNYIVISEPYEGFPAQKSGLKAGDLIISIDGVEMKDKTTQEVSEKLKGAANTTIKVKVERPYEKKPLSFDITREKIQINPVSFYGMANNEVGYIVLTNFTTNCSEELRKAFLDLRDNFKAKGVIIDLRSNGGGLLDEAIKITNFFVPRGSDVVSTKGKVKQMDKIYKAVSQPIDTVLPLAVLINRNSASASEILAGSLQDHDRAVIIGQRSFGKGLVQTTRPLSYNSQLKITTAKYYIPSGRCIQAIDYSHRNEDGSVGLVPDSLISEFKTKNGRKVYDGGGISPDITTEQNSGTNILYALAAQMVFFDYATKFAFENPKITAAENFEISDDIFADFKKFVSTNKDFTYKSKTQDAFKTLKETAEGEKYFEHAKSEFEALEKMIVLDTQRDLDLAKKDIQEILALEIVKRYYYQKGQYKLSLKSDVEIIKATEIIGANKKDYYDLLSGVKESHAGDKRLSAKKSE